MMTPFNNESSNFKISRYSGIKGMSKLKIQKIEI